MRTVRRLLPVLLVVALVAAACGDDDSGSGPETTSTAGDDTSLSPEDLTAAADAVVAEWGAEDGFAVVLLAADAGYTAAQIVDHPEIGVDGSLEGVDPAGEPQGGIEPAEGSSTPDSEDDDGEEQSLATPEARLASYRQAPGARPSDAYVTWVDQTAGELFTVAEDHLRDLEEAETAPAEEEDAEEESLGELATLEVLGLLARGYTVEQITEAIVLGDVGVHVNLGPFICFGIGTPPDGFVLPPGPDQLEEACGPLNELEHGPEASLPEGLAAGSLEVYDGTYTSNDPIERDPGAIIEVLSTDTSVTVADGTVSGSIVEVATVQTGSGEQSKIEQSTQTIELAGTVQPDGTFEGTGTTTATYELLSCQPEDLCRSATATQSVAGGTALTLTGFIEDGAFRIEMVNSVSGAEAAVDALKE